MACKSFCLIKIISVLFLLSSISCSNPATENSSEADSTGSSALNADDNSESQPTASASSPSKNVCDRITKAELTNITGKEYETATSQADFPTIKHCEYRSADLQFTLSLLIAFGDQAKARMTQAKQVPGHKAVADFLDEAIWEPAQGALTAISKDQCVEIKVSQPHGDDATRIEFAKKIGKLMLERF